MGLLLSKTTETGYQAEYWKIIKYNVDILEKRANVCLGLYKDKLSADSGMKPLQTVWKSLVDRADEEGKTVDTYFTDYINHDIVGALYSVVKVIPYGEDLSKATDVIEKEITK